MVIDRPLIFGPAYLDLVLEIDRPVIPGVCLDQNVRASHVTPRADGQLRLLGPTGDRVVFRLTDDAADIAADIHLIEPILARRCGPRTERVVIDQFEVKAFRRMLGGMGAGYAKALTGTLRFPIGDDAVARFVYRELADYGIEALSVVLHGVSSDCSYIILSPGEKVAVGSREAMLSWQATPDDKALVTHASAVAFCGATNSLMREVLADSPDIPVLCAPSTRNVDDTDVPLVTLADRIHYMTLNALEWEHLQGKDAFLAQVLVISVTDGPNGCRIYLRGGQEFALPAGVPGETIDVNRAGETFGSTFFKVLLHEDPAFYRKGSVSESLARNAAQIATHQATRQLAITGFAFPPDDWKEA